MFTGIVQHLGAVASLKHHDSGARLQIDMHGWEHRPARGESIAVNGCCLTVAEISQGTCTFDVVHQTLKVTTLGSLECGDLVNLECAVTSQTLLGGHIVQGHVDGVAEVVQVLANEQQHRLRIRPPADLIPLAVEKGSIAVDGVSLTIAGVGGDWFEVALIPTTLQMTTLGRLLQGSKVNLEADYLAKIVIHALHRAGFTMPQK